MQSNNNHLQGAAHQSTSGRSAGEGSSSNQRLLPASAPVSSLLPPIPQVSAPATATMAQAQSVQQQAQQLALLLQSGALQGGSLSSAPTSTPFPRTSTAQIPAPNSLMSSAAQLLQVPPQAQHHHHHHRRPQHQVAAASVQPAVASALAGTVLPGSMQKWTLDQLVAHVELLKTLKQPVPHALSMLISESQRREEKKTAKRVANRKSASVSRARKKAMVQEMTELNARLRRQAMILSLLPDLVITVDLDGVITFCNEQVERVLRHRAEDMTGSKLTDLLISSSRGKFQSLLKKLVDAENGTDDEEDMADGADGEAKEEKKPAEKKKLKRQEVSDESGEKMSAGSGADEKSGSSAAVVSDPSFPLSVVKVDAPSVKPKGKTDENENSDTSTSRDSKNPSSLTHSASLTRSPTAESLGNSGSGSDESDKKNAEDKKKKKKVPSSDTSNSSLSADVEAKNLLTANANLERNVRWHNKKMQDKHKLGEAFKDDVIGAGVTANNASARLSSLRVQVRTEGTSSEEDSGYRESNESREETSSSSASDSPDSTEPKDRGKPMAPACNICLIRDDLTTIWCEVTSSIRNREFDEGGDDTTASIAKKPRYGLSSESDSASPKPPEVELLLCLRPLRDGEKVNEKYRFPRQDRQVSDDSNTGNSSGSGGETSANPSSSSNTGGSPPPKKRPQIVAESDGNDKKRIRLDPDTAVKPTADTDVDIAASLMMMSNKN